MKAFGTGALFILSGIREEARERRYAHPGHQIVKLRRLCAKPLSGNAVLKAGGKVLAQIDYCRTRHYAGIIQQGVLRPWRIHSRAVMGGNGYALGHLTGATESYQGYKAYPEVFSHLIPVNGRGVFSLRKPCGLKKLNWI